MPPHLDSDSGSATDGATAAVARTIGKSARKASKYDASSGESDDDNDNDDGKRFATPDLEPRKSAATNGRADDQNEEYENDASEGVDEGDEVYIVEKVVKHAVAENDTIIYEIKWKDYPSSQNTWETEENLEGAKDLLKSYFTRIGGRPVDETNPRDANKKRGRNSMGGAEPPMKRSKAEQIAIRNGRRKSGKPEDVEEAIEWPGVKADSDWQPPRARKDSWEDILLKIEALDFEDDGTKWAFVLWSLEDENGKKRTSKVLLDTVSIAAPQATIRFFRAHLVFRKTKDETKAAAA